MDNPLTEFGKTAHMITKIYNLCLTDLKWLHVGFEQVRYMLNIITPYKLNFSKQFDYF